MSEPGRESGPTPTRKLARHDSPDVSATDARRGSAPRRWLVWSVLALLIVAGSGGWWYWSGAGRGAARQTAGQQSAAAPPDASRSGARVPADVATASKIDLPIFLNGLGTVQAFNSVTIRSRVDGELIQIAFQEGQTVHEGDLIARIDPRPYQATLDQAVARKTQNEATLASTKLDLERTRQLATRSFASQQQLDQQTANVAAQTAQLASDQAAIESAQTQLGYATIRAPLTGRLGLRLIDQGNIVRSGDATGIVEIAQLQPISVLFTAPESQLGAILAAKRAGDVKVTALASDNSVPLGEGVLALVNNVVDPASGTVRLKATFPNRDDRLWPGLSVNTRLLVDVQRGVTTVPEDAILRGQNEMFAFVVGEDGRAEKRVLKVGAITAGQAVILDGLREGERVAITGQSRLQPGARVEIGRSDRPVDGTRDSRAADAGAPAPRGVN